MIIARPAENEDERLQELFTYEVLDTPEDPEFDNIVKLAAQICQTPVALVSLVDSYRQWFKAGLGLGRKECPRDISFCSHAIQRDEIMIVEDALKDERFFDNPLVVDGPKVRFYAGKPLVSPAGLKLGTLCVLDNKPRTLNQEQIIALETLSAHVVEKFELKRQKNNLRELFQQYLNLQDAYESRLKAYDTAQRSAEVGIYELNLKTDKLKVSGSFCNLFGLPEEGEYSGKDIHELVHADDYEQYIQFFKGVLEHEKQYDYEYRVLRKDNGEEIFIRSTGEVIRNKNGKAHRILGIKQNITGKKQSEEELKSQNEELLKVNNELDHFVSRVSHDLRAPISTALGLIELVLKHENDVDKIKELLGHVRNSLNKQDYFIRDILDYSRNSRMPLLPEVVDFRKMTEDIFSQLVYSYESDKVKHSLHIEQKEDFFSDKSRLYIVLTNLLSNAFKYLSPHKELAEVRVEVKVERKQALVKVKDNGMGIEKKHLDRVFDMFYRATDKKPGSGLGLYIVKESVAKLSGQIIIESEAGKGTCIELILPDLREEMKNE